MGSLFHLFGLPSKASSLIDSSPGLEVKMELWTDYEGRTIDGAYPLTKLISPEGRSAFFSTSNGTGVPTVIRLIESHFDDEEILSRWRAVAALDHPNLVTMKKYGHVMLDETSLVYAVMEPVEANLGQIVRERRLTVLETRQVASSLLAALEALHGHGFVHEHVEPANVLAVGEAIKLRSDCIREASEEDGRGQKARDVHDYGVVLLQCMTQQKSLDGAARELPLTAPFDEIVRKSISGEWGLTQISKALGPAPAPVPARRVVRDASAGSKTSDSAAVSPSGAPTGAADTAGLFSAAASAPPAASVRATEASVATSGVPVPGVAAAASSSSAHATTGAARTAAASPAAAAAASSAYAGSFVSARRRVAMEEERTGQGRGLAFRAVAIFLVLAVMFLAWHFLHSRPAEQGTAAAPIATPAPILENGAASPAAANRAPAVAVAGEHAPQADAAAAASGQWRVVAFTYNHEEQARDKVAALAKAHPDLRFGVFAPAGHSPYLVTIGGSMSREEAFALSGKAKREGLPRDVYAQNYRAKR